MLIIDRWVTCCVIEDGSSTSEIEKEITLIFGKRTTSKMHNILFFIDSNQRTTSIFTIITSVINNIISTTNINIKLQRLIFYCLGIYRSVGVGTC